MKTVEVLIPTCNRPLALAITLTGLLGQTFRDFAIIISDQSDEPVADRPEIQALARLCAHQGIGLRIERHLPRRGMAEQRQFLLDLSRAPYVLYLDDDLYLEPPVVERMVETIRREGCGFVGCACIGLRFRDDVRPHEQQIDLWEGPVRPEPFTWETIPWERHRLHNAANPLHLAERLADRIAREGVVRYKVVWVGGNVLYDRAKLLAVGGFSFWPELPPEHCGEEVAVQILLLRTYGGCGLLPSGTYHLELPTTIPDRRHNTDAIIRRRLAVLAGPPAHGG